MSETYNLSSTGNVKLLQHLPDGIRLYSVQETELRMIAQGGESRMMQVAYVAFGVLGGALPSAIGALSSYSQSGKVDLAGLSTIVLGLAGLLMGPLCIWCDRNQKTHPQILLQQILDRKNVPPAAEA